MGLSGSKELENADCTDIFSVEMPENNSDNNWSAFLSNSYQGVFRDLETEEGREKIATTYKKLIRQKRRCGRLPYLIRQIVKRLNARPSNYETLREAANGLYLLRVYLKLMVEHLDETDILAQCNSLDDNVVVVGEDGSTPMEAFLVSLLKFLASVPVNDETRLIHKECAMCLLVLLSVQLFSDLPTSSFFIYRCIMQGPESPFSAELTRSLLQNFVKTHVRPGQSGSIVIDLAAGLWNLAFGNEERDGRMDTLANLSIWLLLVFVHHCTDERYIANPFRRFLFTFTKTEPVSSDVPVVIDETADRFSSLVDAVTFDMNSLYQALCSTVEQEAPSLLLYTLLHHNVNVRTYIMARTDIELLILPILKTLYSAGSSSSYHVYMCLVIILIFTEDDLFCKTVHHISLKNISWLSERSVREVSLGGLIIIVLLKTIQQNIMAMRDKYLHCNCLAALANMSSHFSNLHPYVAQRLIDLFEGLLKKYEKLKNELHPQTSNKSQTHDDSDAGSTVIENHIVEIDVDRRIPKNHQLAVLEEGLRTIAETINIAVHHNLRSNTNLVYAILHKKAVFERLRGIPEFEEATKVLFSIITYFSAILDKISDDPTEYQVTESIIQGSLRMSLPNSNSQELKFKYVEDETPENFFMPYVWYIIQSNSLMHFDSKQVRTKIDI